MLFADESPAAVALDATAGKLYWATFRGEERSALETRTVPGPRQPWSRMRTGRSSPHCFKLPRRTVRLLRSPEAPAWAMR